jgi:hypothetical protein
MLGIISSTISGSGVGAMPGMLTAPPADIVAGASTAAAASTVCRDSG